MWQSFLETLLENLRPISWTEALAASLGIVSVIGLQLGRIWGYPLGMISVGAYVWICYEAKIYAHMGVNAYYLLMNVYGWWCWLRGANGKPIPYSYIKLKEYKVLLVSMPLCFTLLYFLLKRTDTDVAFWDALTTTFWAVATWLLARKRVENWLFWIVADLICIPLYFQKGLLLTSLQMCVFLGLATAGFVNWRQLYRKQKRISEV